MDTITQSADQYRDQVIALGIALQPTHWVTLNLHRDATLDHALRQLKRWRVEVLRRLCGRRFFEKADADLIEFLGCPERSLAGHPHFHLACRVPAAIATDFARVAEARWKAIVSSGTSDIQIIDKNPNSLSRVLAYATKHLNPRSSLPFVHSQLLH